MILSCIPSHKIITILLGAPKPRDSLRRSSSFCNTACQVWDLPSPNTKPDKTVLCIQSAPHKAGYFSQLFYVPVARRHGPIFSLTLSASLGKPAEGYPASSAMHSLSSEAARPLRGDREGEGAPDCLYTIHIMQDNQRPSIHRTSSRWGGTQRYSDRITTQACAGIVKSYFDRLMKHDDFLQIPCNAICFQKREKRKKSEKREKREKRERAWPCAYVTYISIKGRKTNIYHIVEIRELILDTECI